MSDPSGLGWEERWEQGNTVWHQSNGNKMLRQWWDLPSHKQRVLVPLCGKSLDLLWLEERGHHVTGVELSAIAVQAFFADHDLAYTRTPVGELERYDAQSRNVSIYCGDYFQFTESAFDAVYDRAALIAMPPTAFRCAMSCSAGSCAWSTPWVTSSTRLEPKTALGSSPLRAAKRGRRSEAASTAASPTSCWQPIRTRAARWRRRSRCTKTRSRIRPRRVWVLPVQWPGTTRPGSRAKDSCGHYKSLSLREAHVTAPGDNKAPRHSNDVRGESSRSWAQPAGAPTMLLPWCRCFPAHRD